MLTRQDWLNKCLEWKNKWPVFQEQHEKLEDDSNGINLYKFYQALNENLNPDSVIAWDAGSSLYCSNQALMLDGKNQQSVGSLAQAEMGAALAMAAGVSFAKEKTDCICCIGDGSFNTNPQALSIIKYYNLPVKVFVLNNSGYLSIKNSQDKFYSGRRIGTDKKDGIFFPEIQNIAKVYELQYQKISSISDLNSSIKNILNQSGAVICEVICQEIQDISPGITALKNQDGKMEQCDFSNMAPFIDNIENEMIKI